MYSFLFFIIKLECKTERSSILELDFLMALQQLHNPVLDCIMVVITSVGNAGWFFIVLGVVLLWVKKTRKAGFHVLLSLLFSLIFCNLILKDLVARQRPCWLVPEIQLLIANPSDFSFPSGHTSASMATAASIYLYNKKYGIAMFLLAIMIAFSRMYLFVHFPTDILGGMLTGLLSAFLAYFLIQKVESKKSAA